MKRKIEFDEECCDFMKLSKSEQKPQKRIRLLALGHLKNGMKITKVAASVGVDRHAVGIWYDEFKAHGLAGLDDKPKSGRPPKLKRTKEQDFLKEVEALQNTRSGGRVTGYDIQKMAKLSFDADYAEDSIYTVLKRLNFSWIAARSKHPKSNKDAQEAFKKTSNKKLSKLCQRELT
jgi:transposase